MLSGLFCLIWNEFVKIMFWLIFLEKYISPNIAEARFSMAMFSFSFEGRQSVKRVQPVEEVQPKMFKNILAMLRSASEKCSCIKHFFNVKWAQHMWPLKQYCWQELNWLRERLLLSEDIPILRTTVSPPPTSPPTPLPTPLPLLLPNPQSPLCSLTPAPTNHLFPPNFSSAFISWMNWQSHSQSVNKKDFLTTICH